MLETFRRPLQRLLELKRRDDDETKWHAHVIACESGERFEALLLEICAAYERKWRKLHMHKRPSAVEADDFVRLTRTWSEIREKVVEIGS